MTTGNDILVELDDVGVRADGRWIVRHVSFAVRRRRIVTLIGPNGGGKTTTIRAALGIMPVSEGEVRKAPRLRVGYVPQKLALDPSLPLTVARFMRLTAPATPAEVIAALEMTGVAHCMGRQVRQLSGGELQRVLIARAMLRRPDLMVLDEPVQGVDFAGEAALYEIIGRLRDELGCGVLLVSHDLHFVMAGTDHVVCINSHICCQGTPHAVAETEEYAELFGPAALARLAAYTHHHDHVHSPDGHVCGGDDCARGGRRDGEGRS